MSNSILFDHYKEQDGEIVSSVSLQAPQGRDGRIFMSYIEWRTEGEERIGSVRDVCVEENGNISVRSRALRTVGEETHIGKHLKGQGFHSQLAARLRTMCDGDIDPENRHEEIHKSVLLALRCIGVEDIKRQTASPAR